MTILLVPACFPSDTEAASCGAASEQALVALRRGSPQSAFAHLRESILFCITKEKQLFSWLVEKRVITGQSREVWQEVKMVMKEERERGNGKSSRDHGGESRLYVNDVGRRAWEGSTRHACCHVETSRIVPMAIDRVVSLDSVYEYEQQ
jgi:hypothetical protein